jgi:hypothetical protein
MSVAWVGAGIAAVGVISNASAANKASKTQQQSASDANALAKQTSDDQIALQREMFNKNVELQQPAIDAGNTSRNRLMQLLGLSAGGADNGSLMKDFSMADFQADPGYQFRQDQGQQALERSAAARGGLMSGAALKDTARFSQGLASQEYQSAFDRFQTNRVNKQNPLLSLAGSAQTASGALGAAGQNFANSAGNALGQYASTASQNITGAGNARASGYVGTANAISSGLSQGYGMYQQNQLLSMMNKRYSGGADGYTMPGGESMGT